MTNRERIFKSGLSKDNHCYVDRWVFEETIKHTEWFKEIQHMLKLEFQIGQCYLITFKKDSYENINVRHRNST